MTRARVDLDAPRLDELLETWTRRTASSTDSSALSWASARPPPQDLLAPLRPAAGPDPGKLRLRLPALDREEPRRDARHWLMDPRAGHRADPGTAGHRQDPPDRGLGVKAVENGFSVAFYHLDDLLHAKRQDADSRPSGCAARSTSTSRC